MQAYSLLDLSPITDNGDASSALLNSRDLARHAESWGYKRFWMAEPTIWRAWPARRRRWCWVLSPRVRKASVSPPAV